MEYFSKKKLNDYALDLPKNVQIVPKVEIHADYFFFKSKFEIFIYHVFTGTLLRKLKFRKNLLNIVPGNDQLLIAFQYGKIQIYV